MSAQKTLTDHINNTERSFHSSFNARSTISNNDTNLATNNEAQYNNFSDNRIGVEVPEANDRLRRRSATSTNETNRRASKLSYNNSQGHHHHHYHHQVPQPRNIFKPFTRESLEAIKARIKKENERKLQIHQTQQEVDKNK